MSKISSKRKRSKRVHVISRKDGWAIKKEDKTRGGVTGAKLHNFTKRKAKTKNVDL